MLNTQFIFIYLFHFIYLLIVNTYSQVSIVDLRNGKQTPPRTGIAACMCSIPQDSVYSIRTIQQYPKQSREIICPTVRLVAVYSNNEVRSQSNSGRQRPGASGMVSTRIERSVYHCCME